LIDENKPIDINLFIPEDFGAYQFRFERHNRLKVGSVANRLYVDDLKR